MSSGSPTTTMEDVASLVAERPGTVWLDGATSGWSLLVWDPVEVCTNAADWPAVGRRLTGRGAAGDLPFRAGCVGYVGYGAGATVEAVPPGAPSPEPPVSLGRYEGGLLRHEPSGTWHAVGSATVQAEARALLASAPTSPPPHEAVPRACRSVPQASYEAAIERILTWIGEGDVYQVNLSRAVQVDGVDDPWEAYRRLRRGRPDRGAWLSLPDGICILSNSPETLLDVDGDALRTVPIKGTRRRAPGTDIDDPLADELAHDAKEIAELTMIVDLCRNDVGRVAKPGSVRVGPREVVAHANVFHAHQAVLARLRPGTDAWDALAAVFPPGSVVGAPKVRAAARIDALEPHPRGAYCGTIGFASDTGTARWSVAIRTAVVTPTQARFHVGGGIVADSVPRAEWEETEAKGTELRRALAGCGRP